MKIKWEGIGKNNLRQTPKQHPPADYIAYYKFNGNADDETGNWDGITNDVTLTTDRFGNANRAYHFGHSSSSRINVGSVVKGASKFTISYWVKRSSLSGNDVVMSSQVMSGNYPGFVSRYMGADPRLYITTHWHVYSGTSTTTDWQHFVILFKGSDYLNIYVDNVLYQHTISVSLDGSETDLYFGNDITNSPDKLIGDMTDIRIYDRILTSDEVALLYNESNPI